MPADAKAEIFEGVEPGGAVVLNRDNSQFARLRARAEQLGGLCAKGVLHGRGNRVGLKPSARDIAQEKRHARTHPHRIEEVAAGAAGVVLGVKIEPIHLPQLRAPGRSIHCSQPFAGTNHRPLHPCALALFEIVAR